MYKKLIWMVLLYMVPSFFYAQMSSNEITKRFLDGERNIAPIIDEIEGQPIKEISALAEELHQVGIQNYSDEETIEYAIFCTSIGLKLREGLDAIDLNTGKSAFNLGIFYGYNGEYGKSEKHLLKALEIYEKIKNQERYIRSCNGLGVLYQKFGDYERGLNYLETAASLAFESQDLVTYSESLLNVGHLLVEYEKYNMSIESLAEAEKYFIQNDDLKNLFKCYLNMGNAYDELGDRNAAINYYEKALNYSGYVDSDEVVKLENNLGLTLIKNNQLDEALKHLKKGDVEATRLGASDLMAQSKDNLGEYYLKRKDFPSAINMFEEAAKLLVGGGQLIDLNEALLKNVAYKKDLLTIFSDLGNALQSLYDENGDSELLLRALEVYQTGDKLIDLMREEHGGADSKLFWRKKVKSFFEGAISVCYKLQSHELAFEFFEKSKSILLLEALLSNNANFLIPKEIFEKERNLRLRLDFLRKKEAYEKIVSVEKEYSEMLASIKLKYPKYSEAKFSEAVSTLVEVQQSLNSPQESYLHSFWGQDYIYWLSINNRGTLMYRVKNDSLIIRNVETYLNQVRSSSANIDSYVSSASFLYDTLLKDILNNYTDVNSLMIFPDGVLNFIPFEALLTASPNTKTSAVNNYPYMINSFKLSYAYSFSILEKQRKAHANSKENQLLLFAPFANNNIRGERLKYSSGELASASRLCKSESLLDDKATIEAFEAMAPLNSIIHIIAHGESSIEPSKSFISFYDEDVSLHTLYSMDIPAKLVILSACETNLGRLYEGEGVMSLARGFTYAGVSSILSSQWKISDSKSQSVLDGFYKYLKEGKSKSEALQYAKTEYLNKDENDGFYLPYYWSGIILLGNDDALVSESASSFPYMWPVILGVLFLFLALYLIRKNSGSKKS